jgi:hypothetical protein
MMRSQQREKDIAAPASERSIQIGVTAKSA